MRGEPGEGSVTVTACPGRIVCARQGSRVPFASMPGVMTRHSENERAEGIRATLVANPVGRIAIVTPIRCGCVLGRQHAADGGHSGEWLPSAADRRRTLGICTDPGEGSTEVLRVWVL